MKKLAVIVPGWQFGIQFFESIIAQHIPTGWEVDYFIIAHRMPEDKETIQEKEAIRKEWIFLDNGRHHKRILPRISFGFYTKELIDMMGGDMKFMFEDLMTRKGEKSSPNGIMGLNEWNIPAGRFFHFLEQNNLLDRMAYLSNTKRVSAYCLEGERGYVSHTNAGGQERYLNHVITQLKAIGLAQ
mgnify:CR=1 FL=1